VRLSGSLFPWALEAGDKQVPVWPQGADGDDPSDLSFVVPAEVWNFGRDQRALLLIMAEGASELVEIGELHARAAAGACEINPASFRLEMPAQQRSGARA